MKTIDFIEAQVRMFVESRRPPVELRDKVDLGFSFIDNVLIIHEIQPRWDNPSEKINSPVAKARLIT